MKTFIKVLGIISITLASLILFKFVNIIIGITFFIIGIGLFVYFGFILSGDRKEKLESSEHSSYEDMNKIIYDYTKLLNKKCEIPYDLIASKCSLVPYDIFLRNPYFSNSGLLST